MRIFNTCFKDHERRLYTWKIPGVLKKYQIDFVLVNHRFAKRVKNSKILPGANADTDHNLLIADIQAKLKQKQNTHEMEHW